MSKISYAHLVLQLFLLRCFRDVGFKVPLDENLLDSALLKLVLCPFNKPGKEKKSQTNAACLHSIPWIWVIQKTRGRCPHSIACLNGYFALPAIGLGNNKTLQKVFYLQSILTMKKYVCHWVRLNLGPLCTLGTLLLKSNSWPPPAYQPNHAT